MIKKYKKILIANRGEIAIRIARTCREMGIETVSVHSVEDENSLHVKLTDESVCIGPASSQESYLNIPAILSAVDITGAEAVHPGYGFLAENAEFAKACHEFGVDFIGPNADIIRSMGDKIRSKRIAIEAGVPILESINVDSDNLIQKIEEMGFPVIIKASAGGGGRGMRIVDNKNDITSTIQVLKREALAAFGDDTLFVEKYIERPRHIEVQILGDKHNSLIHLGERDCSVQRRFQKVLEEAPSGILSEDEREAIWESAVKISKYVNYDSVGTVEFLFDLDSRKHYFMEMNTRIQVEHPVTEEYTGVDLIKHQILVSQGEKLSLEQADIKFNGHVIELRINAEDPVKMLPSPGLVNHYHRPGGIGVRVDDYIYTGYIIPAYYDSLVAKVIISGSNRDECIRRALRALSETVVGGVKTNIELHQNILENPSFQQDDFSTSFLKTL